VAIAEGVSARARRATLPVTLFVQAAASAAVIGPTVAAPRLLERLLLGPAAVGLYIAAVYLAAMFSSSLGALLVRSRGPIRASQLALCASAAGLALLAMPSVWAAAAGALLIGIGYGPITPASSQMLSRTTEAHRYGLVFSIKQTGVPLGGVVAGLMVPALVTLSGAVAALAGTGALCLLAAALAQPLSGTLDRERDGAVSWPRPAQLLAPVRFVAAHPVLRPLVLVSFVLSMVQVSLTSYMVSYLTADLRWTLLAAGAALSASQVAGMAGRIAWGLLADRWLGPRRTLLGLAGVMAACCLAMPWLAIGTPAAPVLALLCVFGATAVGWNGVYLATVARQVPQSEAAMATGGSLFFTFFGVVVGPPLFGLAGTAFGGLGGAFALLALPLAVSLWMLARTGWG